MFQARKIKIALATSAFFILFTTDLAWHGLVVTVLIVLARHRLRELQNIKFWLTFVLLAFLPYILIHSQQMLALSCLVFCRSVAVYLAFLTIAENINIDTLNRNLPKIVGHRLAMIVGLAFNLMPIVRNILLKSYALFYFKKTTNISLLKRAISYALAVFRRIINAADCCAENMYLTQIASSPTPKIVIISGAKHSGKTTCATALVEEFKARGWPISGILAPSTMEDNRRTTIYLTDIQTGDKKPLASRKDHIIPDAMYNYGGFYFSRAGYQFARNALLNHAPGGIVFLDEFGPLEFGGLGHAKEFAELIKANNISALYLVIREELLDRFKSNFPHLSCEIIKVEEQSAQKQWLKNQLLQLE